MRVFIAGPYSAETMPEVERNVHRAMVAGMELMYLGHEPFVPHLSHWMGLAATGGGDCIPYARWVQWSLAFVECCDGLLYLAPSPGADRERARAVELGLPIWESVAEIARIT
jgi:hypothetical protein